MGYDVKFVSCTAIKSQALADFIAEWTEVQAPTPEISHEYWTLYFDGSVMGPGAGAGVVLFSPEGGKFQYAVRLHFPTSNNVVEYEALISGLRIGNPPVRLLRLQAGNRPGHEELQLREPSHGHILPGSP